MKKRNSKVFPRKFCQVRWVENTVVAERALQGRKYVQNFLKLPSTITVEAVKSLCADKFAAAKIAFFASVGSEFEIFLEKCSSPMVAYLFNDIGNLLRSLMKRFVKKSMLQETNSVTKLVKVDVNKKDLLCTYKEVDVGVAAAKELVQVKAVDSERMAFRM